MRERRGRDEEAEKERAGSQSESFQKQLTCEYKSERLLSVS